MSKDILIPEVIECSLIYTVILLIHDKFLFLFNMCLNGIETHTEAGKLAHIHYLLKKNSYLVVINA